MPETPLTCPCCEGWGRTVRADERGTEPCRDPIHNRVATTPRIGPTAGEALEIDRCHDARTRSASLQSWGRPSTAVRETAARCR